MIRVVVGGEGLSGFSVGEFTDSYVKLLFPPTGADYLAPFDVDEIRAAYGREHWPVTRTYTVRAWDEAAKQLTFDFVHHGYEGLAGSWAANAKSGDPVSFYGPGGGYAPSAAADWHLFVADESALPAVSVALERLAPGVPARVFLEVEDVHEQQDLRSRANVSIRWISRADSSEEPGSEMVRAVTSAELPEGEVHAFVHGEAGLVREIRRHLRLERGVDRDKLSASGYWRRGRTDEAWRAEKADWKRQVDHDDEQVADSHLS